MSLAMRPNEVNTEVQYDCKVRRQAVIFFIYGGTEHEKEPDGDRIPVSYTHLDVYKRQRICS